MTRPTTWEHHTSGEESEYAGVQSLREQGRTSLPLKSSSANISVRLITIHRWSGCSGVNRQGRRFGHSFLTIRARRPQWTSRRCLRAMRSSSAQSRTEGLAVVLEGCLRHGSCRTGQSTCIPNMRWRPRVSFRSCISSDRRRRPRPGKHDTPWHCRDGCCSMVIAAIDPDPVKAAQLKRCGRAYWHGRWLRKLHHGRGRRHTHQGKPMAAISTALLQRSASMIPITCSG